MKKLYLVTCLLTVLFLADSLFAQNNSHYRIKSGHKRSNSDKNDLPPYMPKPHPSWEGVTARGRFVRKYSTPIAPLGLSIGRSPSKSSGKKLHPAPSKGRSGFGSVGRF